MACGTTSNNMRMANKVTPSCQCCSVSVCTMRWKSCNSSQIPGSFFSCTSATCSLLSSPRRTREIFNLLENTLLKSRHSLAHWQNTCLECLWRATSQYRRYWRRRVEPERCNDPGNFFGQWRDSVEDRGRTASGGAQIVGFHPLEPRFALRLAGAHQMRRTSLPSSVAHRLSQLNTTSVFGGPWKHCWAQAQETTHRHVANEDGEALAWGHRRGWPSPAC